MGKKSRQQRKALRRQHGYHQPRSVILDEELKQLKADIDLVTLTFDEDKINDLWSRHVLDFNSQFLDVEEKIPTSNLPNGPSRTYLLQWDQFLDDFWDACVGLMAEPTRLKYLVAYVNKRSEDTWKMTNDTDHPIPAEYLLVEATCEGLYHQIVGYLRKAHIWRDQLLWSCEFLNISLP